MKERSKGLKKLPLICLGFPVLIVTLSAIVPVSVVALPFHPAGELLVRTEGQLKRESDTTVLKSQGIPRYEYFCDFVNSF